MSAVEFNRKDSVAELKLVNPKKLNAFTVEMLLALGAHCASIERDDAIRAVVVSAEGERAFCTGADISEWQSLSPAEFARIWVRKGHRVFDRLAGLSKPTVAAINGHVFGGGLELAAACDIRVIAPHAKLGLPETGVGIVPGWSGTQRIMRLLPEPVVKEMALFGRRLSAERAMDLGFIAEITDDVNALAFEIADRAAKLSPRACEITKYMLHAGAGEDSAAMIEALGGGLIAGTDDKHEGVSAFFDKRQPEFPGN